MPFRILIADDHNAMRGILRALIESHEDLQVCAEAVNGVEAVAKAEECKPDLVILDLAMPLMDGVRAAREISSTSPALPILMHTMHASSTLDLEAKKAGVTMVLNKGEDGEKLLAAIHDLLHAARRGGMPGANASRLEVAADANAPAVDRSGDAATAGSEGQEEPTKPN